jgi:hypothetical protein
MLRLLLALLVGCLAGLSAQEARPAPVDGIRDDTRALAADARQKLAAEMAAFRARHGIDVWLVAETFQMQAGGLKDRARLLRQAWSGDRDAVLILYDRSSDREYTSISPGLWEMLPSAGIYQLHTSLHEVMTDRKKPSETRLAEAAAILLKGIAGMKSREAMTTNLFTRDYGRMLRAFAGLLLAGAILAWLVGGMARRRHVHAARQVFLPKLGAVPRLGAPHGAEVISSPQV